MWVNKNAAWRIYSAWKAEREFHLYLIKQHDRTECLRNIQLLHIWVHAKTDRYAMKVFNSFEHIGLIAKLPQNQLNPPIMWVASRHWQWWEFWPQQTRDSFLCPNKSQYSTVPSSYRSSNVYFYFWECSKQVPLRGIVKTLLTKDFWSSF